MLKKDLINSHIEKNGPIAERIRADNNITRGSSKEAYAFIITCLKFFFPRITYNGLKNCITDNYDDEKFDAIYFHNKKKRIYIIEAKRNGEYTISEIEQFKNNIKKYFFRSPVDYTNFRRNPHLIPIIKRVRRLLNRPQWKLKIFVLRNDIGPPEPRAVRILKPLKDSYPRIESVDLLNSHGIVDYIFKDDDSDKEPFPIRILSGCKDDENICDEIVIRNRRGGEIEALFGRLSLLQLVKLQQKYGSELFAANVRDFQKKKNLKDGILNSINNSPKNFFVYHNGITLSCDKIDFVRGKQYKITNPQVINGCQTVNTIYNEYHDNVSDPNFKQASILCKFYSLKKDMIEKVCEATNTQINIHLWDLRSNDKIQKVFETALKAKNLTYKRKGTSSKQGVITITDLAQWIYASKYKKPADAKNKKKELFDLLVSNEPENVPYNKIFKDNYRLTDLVNICEIGQFVKNKVKGARRGDFKKFADLHFIAGIYYMGVRRHQSTRNEKYNQLITFAEEIIDDMRREDEDITFNAIFTKDENTWAKMKEKIDSLF